DSRRQEAVLTGDEVRCRGCLPERKARLDNPTADDHVKSRRHCNPGCESDPEWSQAKGKKNQQERRWVGKRQDPDIGYDLLFNREVLRNVVGRSRVASDSEVLRGPKAQKVSEKRPRMGHDHRRNSAQYK